MSRFKKGLAAAVGVCVMAAGGFAAATALAAHTGGTAWTAGNCSAAAENLGAQSKTVSAVYNGVDANGMSCSLTISGKFMALPAKNVPVSSFVHIAADPASGTYTGTIKSKTFRGTLTLATASPLTSNNPGCGWTYMWIGGHWVAMYTTC